MPENLEQSLKQIESEFGVGAIQKMDSNKVVDIPAIPTGSLQLNDALGIGGLPRGRIVEIYGPESSGKTTVCQHVIANAHAASPNALCGFIDVEHAIDPQYMERTGVDLGRVFISQPDCGEDALSIAESLVRSNALDVIVVDSVAALVPRAEIEGQMGDSHVGLQARLMSQALRKLTAAVSHSKTCLIFTNQIREKIGVMFGNPETTSGGNALKFYASVRMDIRRKEQIKDKDGEVIGNKARIKVVKNKVAPPFRQAEFDIMYPIGIDPGRDILNYAVDKGVVSKRGAWFSFEDENIGQGFEASCLAVREDKELLNRLKEKIAELNNDKGSPEPDSENKSSDEEVEDEGAAE